MIATTEAAGHPPVRFDARDPGMDRLHTTELFGREVSVGRGTDLAERLQRRLDEGGQSILFCNVHMLMLSEDDARLAAAMDQASLVMPDGAPIAWLQRRLGKTEADLLRGEAALELACHRAVASGRAVGFLGATEEVLAGIARNLGQRHPGLAIDYLHAPPRYDAEMVVETEIVEEINARNLFCLFVGLGCPRQEIWVSLHAPRLNCSVLAIGAVFDWTAGTVTPPPAWMVRTGLAWLYRLVQNPRRMWRRYLVYNSRFAWKVAGLLLSRGRASDKSRVEL